jgi:hypothetical protein
MNKFSSKNEDNQYAYTSVLPLTAIGVKVRKMKLWHGSETPGIRLTLWGETE